MKANQEFKIHSSRKMFFKLAIVGCFLLGFVYTFLLLFNSVLNALH